MGNRLFLFAAWEYTQTRKYRLSRTGQSGPNSNTRAGYGSMMLGQVRFVAVTGLVFFSIFSPSPPAAAQRSEATPGPKLAYGELSTLPPPRTLAFSINPDHIIADAAAWKAQGVGGFFMDGVASEWSSNVWATDGKPHTIGASDETFQKVCQATALCKDLDMEVYLKLVYANPLEWFNNTAWQQIEHNFKQFAIFARDAGCKGVAVDIEYVGQQYAFDWEGYDYDGYTRTDLVNTIRERSTAILRAMYAEFPDMVFLILPEESFTLGTHIEAAWIEEAARVNAPGGVHLFMESTYTVKDIRRAFACAAADVQLLRRVLSPEAFAYWEAKCSLASGVWPTGFDVLNHDSAADLPEHLRQSWAASLMLSPRYNWIYLDRYAEQHMGRQLDAYPGLLDFEGCAAILREKQVATNKKHVSIARALRQSPEDDFAQELGLAPTPRFMFPYGVPMLELEAVNSISTEELQGQWKMALEYFNGVDQDFQAMYRPVCDWQIIGPFPSAELLKGHDVVFPPEQAINLNASYEGASGPVSWRPYRVPEGGLGIDLKTLYEPSENVTAYALCWVESPTKQKVQARFSSNDAGKLWIGGKLVDDFPRESWSVLDRDIIPITLPKGRTPILAKVTNGIGGWALVLRFTDSDGHPLPDLTFHATP